MLFALLRSSHFDPPPTIFRAKHGLSCRHLRFYDCRASLAGARGVRIVDTLNRSPIDGLEIWLERCNWTELTGPSKTFAASIAQSVISRNEQPSAEQLRRTAFIEISRRAYAACQPGSTNTDVGYRALRQYLKRYARRTTDEDFSDDLTQDALVAILQNRKPVHPDKFLLFCRAVLQNTASRQWRRKRMLDFYMAGPLSDFDDHLTQTPDGQPTPDVTFENQVLQDWLWKRVVPCAQLTKREMSLISHLYCNGTNRLAIAQAHKCSRATLAVAIHRAHQKLKCAYISLSCE
jgi:RNA polymerase sigma factor (sigma-70 family)